MIVNENLNKTVKEGGRFCLVEGLGKIHKS
jgi:hypothetical protein